MYITFLPLWCHLFLLFVSNTLFSVILINYAEEYYLLGKGVKSLRRMHYQIVMSTKYDELNDNSFIHSLCKYFVNIY